MNLNLEKIQKIGSIFSIVVLCLVALSSSLTAYAQPQQGLPRDIVPPPESPITSVNQILNIANYVVSLIFTAVIIVAVIMFLWAALTYVTAGGDAAKTKRAGQILVYAAIGLGVALLALGIRALIENFLQTGAGY